MCSIVAGIRSTHKHTWELQETIRQVYQDQFKGGLTMTVYLQEDSILVISQNQEYENETTYQKDESTQQ